MHIEHKQFLELVAEASGIDLEKAEKQLTELINDIKQSLGEGEAYEIEGFGIFSSLGNRVMFIPSDELETEINYKYVGMEPIELNEPKPTFEDPFNALEEAASRADDLDSRFAGLIDDEDIAKLSEEAENEEMPAPGPDKWGVEAHKEDESADRLFASLMGEEYEAPLEESEGIDTSDAEQADDFSDVFADADEGDSTEDLAGEVAAFMTEEPSEEEPLADDTLDDIFADSEDELGDPGIDLIDESVEEGQAEEETVEPTPILEMETSTEPEFEIDVPAEEEDTVLDDLLDEDEQVEEEPAGEESNPELEETEDFDDPFFAIEDEQFDEDVLRMEDLDETEIIPVIKNITTDVPDAEVDEKKSKKQKQKQEKEKKKQDKERKKQEGKDAKEKAKAEKKSKESQPAPAWLWVILILVLAGGSVIGLGYFSILNIPFITPQTASTTVTTTPVQPQVTPAQQPETVSDEQSSDETLTETGDNATQEQAGEPEVQQPETVVNTTSSITDQYGLSGQVSSDGDDGYTIILYTLSNQTNAINEAQKLIDAGYRGFLTPVPSERYGTLYRVSVGQFGSLFDAAVAAEEIEHLLPENYIIKKIN